MKRELRFVDSSRFMASTLDALTKNLTKEPCKNIESKYSGKQLDLLLRKGVYPYDYMDLLERLNEPGYHQRTHFIRSLTNLRSTMRIIHMHSCLERVWL